MAFLVKSTAMCKCAFGVAPTPLIVPPSAKVMACGAPSACIMDNKVIPFGMCSNPSNPAVIAAMGAPVPCTPVIAAPWLPGSPTVLIGGKPALNSSSTLMCAYPGGIITIIPPTAALTVMVP